MEPGYVDHLLTVYTQCMAGIRSPVTTAVADHAGHAARSLSAYLAEAYAS